MNGFVFNRSNMSILKENTATGNAGTGFVLIDFDGSALSENIASRNGEIGFGLDAGSVNSTFKENRACKNGDVDFLQVDGPGAANTYIENRLCTTAGL